MICVYLIPSLPVVLNDGHVSVAMIRVSTKTPLKFQYEIKVLDIS